MIGETFETLYREGATTGRLLVLHLHPWLIGQPFRIGSLDAALGHIVRRQGVWAGHRRRDHRLVPARSPDVTSTPVKPGTSVRRGGELENRPRVGSSARNARSG